MPDRDRITATEPARPADELADVLAAADDVEDFLPWLVATAVSTIGQGISATVTVIGDGSPVTLASSDAHASGLDRQQRDHDEAPCLTVMRTGKPVVVEDLGRERHPAGCGPQSRTAEMRSSVSLPLTGRGRTIGVLSLCSRRAHAFGPTEQVDAERCAAEVARALNLAVRLAARIELTDQVRTTLASRTVLSWAIGIVQSTQGRDARPAARYQPGGARSRSSAGEATFAVARGPRHVGGEVGLCDRPGPHAAHGAPPLGSPSPAAGPVELEATTLAASCWCSSHGGE